jgi:hypothetical protein
LETDLHTSASEPPDFFTVEEAARVLRIARTAAYALASRWRDTDGRQGLPVVPVGRLLRVPRAALEQLAGGPIAAPVRAEDRPLPVSEPPDVAASRTDLPRATNHRNRRARSTSSDQPTLPLT